MTAAILHVGHGLGSISSNFTSKINRLFNRVGYARAAAELRRAGYPKEAATAVKVNIITLHTLGGVIVDSEEDLEKMRSLENRVEQKKKEYFDPSYM